MRTLRGEGGQLDSRERNTGIQDRFISLLGILHPGYMV